MLDGMRCSRCVYLDEPSPRDSPCASTNLAVDSKAAFLRLGPAAGAATLKGALGCQTSYLPPLEREILEWEWEEGVKIASGDRGHMARGGYAEIGSLDALRGFVEAGCEARCEALSSENGAVLSGVWPVGRARSASEREVRAKGALSGRRQRPLSRGTP